MQQTTHTPSVAEKAGVQAAAIGFFLIPITTFSFFAEQYSAPKWIAVYLLSFILFFLSAIRNEKWQLPRSRSFWQVFFGWVALFGFSVAMNRTGSYENQILDWTCLIGLMFIGFDLTRRSDELVSWIARYNFFATLYIMGLGATQALGFDLLPNLGKNEFPVSFFGFQNMTAEFVGISLLIQLYVFRKNQPCSRFLKMWRIFLMTLTVIYLASLHCRTVYVAIVLGLIPGFYRNVTATSLRQHLRSAVALGAVLIGFAIYEGSTLRSIAHLSGIGASHSGLDQAKEGNIQIRKIRWMNTLHMMAEHPIGIGPGRFSLVYPTYHAVYQRDPESTEQMVVRSPHNDYLRVAAEIGLQGVVWLLMTFVCLFRWCRSEFDSRIHHFLITDLSFGVLLYIAGLALFAFPFENAYPFYVTAVFLGIYLAVVIPSATSPIGYLKAGFVLATGVVGVLGFGYTASRYVEVVHADDLEVNAMSCRWFPSNGWTCIQAGHLALERGDVAQAEKIARHLLIEGPDNSYASHLLVLALKAKGKVTEACELAERHARLFGARSTAGSDDVCSTKSSHGG